MGFLSIKERINDLQYEISFSQLHSRSLEQLKNIFKQKK